MLSGQKRQRLTKGMRSRMGRKGAWFREYGRGSRE